MVVTNQVGPRRVNDRPRGTRSDSSRRVGNATSGPRRPLARSLSRSLQRQEEPMSTMTIPKTPATSADDAREGGA
jgi:hypothetical protein